MRSARWLLYLWPGLPQLWWRGALSALVVAVGFALALDVALLATWVWSELLAASVRPLVWPTLGLIWIGGMAATAWRGLSAAAATDLGQREDLFPRTLGEYLRGNWLEAEILCRRLTQRDAGDAEGLLLLATVLRHTGRSDEARSTLAQLRRLDAAQAWEQEIGDELARLADRIPAETNSEIQKNGESQVDDEEHEEVQKSPAAAATSVPAPSSPAPSGPMTATPVPKPKLLDAA